MRLAHCAGHLGVAVIFFLFLAGCGGSGGSDQTSNSGIAFTIYVSSTGGDDTTGDGSSGTPYKSITKALSVAVASDKIKVLPGTYNGANGETFPITVPAGVWVIGDTANKGAGTDPTVISGAGAIAGTPLATFTAVSMGADSRLSGFEIIAGTTALYFGAVAHDVDAVLSYNTYSGSYGGAQVSGTSAATVSWSTFQTNSYGAYQYDPATPTIEHNTFLSGTFQVDGTGSGLVRFNTFNVSSYGIQVQGTSTQQITSNSFNVANHVGISVGSLSAPVIRSNQISGTTGWGVYLAGGTNAGTPDLGTAGSPGGNSFTFTPTPIPNPTSGLDLLHEGTSSINAYGNTWTAAPPVCGTHIVLTGAGSVTFGAGGGENCP